MPVEGCKVQRGHTRHGRRHLLIPFLICHVRRGATLLDRRVDRCPVLQQQGHHRLMPLDGCTV